MKRLIVLSLVIVCCMLFSNPVWAEEPVYFADSNLKAAVEETLGVTDPTPAHMLNLTHLGASERGIVDLTGLESALNLKSLYLSQNSISDIRPLAGLTELIRLDLDDNQIGDISALSGMTKMTRLLLHENEISDISYLFDLAELTDLHINNNQIVDISPLSGLTKLTVLQIYKNQIKDIGPLSSLTDLTLLGLGYNQIEDVGPLAGLTELSWLTLGVNQINDISPLAGLTKLKVLYLLENQISDISSIGGMTELTELILTHNQINEIGVISGLTDLVYLDLGYNQISNIIPLSGLTNLKGLILWDNEISDVSPLQEMTQLEYLHLENNQISDVSALAGMTRLEFLYLSNNMISDVGAISAMMSLRELYLWNNRITSIRSLSNVTSLRVLSLDGNSISDVSPLGGMTFMQRLNLEGNQIGDLSHLATLVNLEELNAGDNQISDISAISGMLKLRVLALGRNRIQDISVLSGLRELQVLHLWENLISDVGALSDKSELVWLSLGHNSITDISALGSMTNLVNLRLWGNSITDLSALKEMNSLEWLDLAWNSIEDISVVSEMTSLRQLNLHDNNISDVSPLGNMTQLQELTLQSNPLNELAYAVYIPLIESNNSLQDGFEYDPPGSHEPVQFADANLKAAVKMRLGIDHDPTQIEMLSLRYLDAQASGIKDLTGLEHALELEELDLVSNQISDISPLSGMTKITHLWLGGNNISDFSALKGMNKLDGLHLWDNQITDISQLSGLTNLRDLHLANNNISDLSSLSGMANLTELDLGRNAIMDISALKGLTRLTALRLYENAIEDISALSEMTQLTFLSLSVNKVSDISALSSMTNLRHLELNINQIDDIDPLAGMIGLERLFLDRNHIGDIIALSGMTGLKELRLDDNQITDIIALRPMHNLEELLLNWNGIVDISALEGMISLEKLELRGNQISDISVLANMTELIELNLENNHISDITVLSSTYDKLRDLYLGGNTISDISVLEDKTGLMSLTLWGNQITDISALAGLTKLQWLALGGNQISNISPLAGMTNLKTLQLRGNHIADISALAEMLKLEILVLSENQIGDVSPLAGMTQLQELHLFSNPLNELAYAIYIPLIRNNNPLTNGFEYDASSIPEYGTVLLVDDDAPLDPGPWDPMVSDPDEDGSGAHPFDSIQEAIDSPLNADVVIVMDGVYSGIGNLDITVDHRSLRLLSLDGPEACIIDCQGEGQGLYLLGSGQENVVIEGFTITGGRAELGSAIFCEGTSPTVVDCIVTQNSDSAVWISDGLYVRGTVTIRSGAVEGAGTMELQDESVLQVQDCPIGCSILGTGRIEVLSGGDTTLMGSSRVDLSTTTNNGRWPQIIKGEIRSSGQLTIQDDAIIRNMSLEIAEAGGVTVIDNGSLQNCDIHAVSDDALTVDSQTHTGSLDETEVFVLLTGDTNFEVRGQVYCTDPVDPLCEPGVHELVAVPALDASTHTIRTMELLPNVKVTLADHFRDQKDNPYDVLYVQELILGAGAELNLAGQRLYYETITGQPGQIVNSTIYTSQLAEVNLSDPNRFDNDVTTNNTPDETFVSLVDSPDTAPEPVLYMQDHDNVSARAKTYLGRFSEDQVIVNFSYLFNSDAPDAVLEVYLSDEEGLLSLDDPHMRLAGRFPPPILGCPGSMESGEFALYSLPVTVRPLDPNQGLWLELILSEPPEPLGGFGFITMGDGRKRGAYARDLTLSSICSGICMDLTGDGRVTPEDYTLIGAGSGRSVDSQVPATSPLSCIDRGYSRDGRTDTGDLVSWGDLMARGGSNDIKNLCSIPMVWEDMSAQVGSAFVSYGLTEPMAAPAAQINSDLLFLGKGSTDIWGQEFLGHEDLLYGFDDVSAAAQAYTLTYNQGQMRLVRGNPDAMILDGDRGLCQLNGDVLVGPGRRTFQGKTVTIGVRKTGDDQLSGRPLRDVAFHNGFAYVVPVIVEESGGTLCQAAAKLELTGDDYEIKRLYHDSTLTPFSNQSPNLQGLRDIEVDGAGRVYLLNAHYQNSSDMLWAFDNTGVLLNRHFLNRLIDNPVENPVGLCYDSHSNRLYIAPGVFEQTHPNQTVLYGYDRQDILEQSTLAPAQTVEIGNLQHVTGISSDEQGTLWITGFTLNKTPEHLFSYDLPYALPGPRLAQVNADGVSVSSVEALSLYGTMAINLPTSVLWVGQ